MTTERGRARERRRRAKTTTPTPTAAAPEGAESHKIRAKLPEAACTNQGVERRRRQKGDREENRPETGSCTP